MALSALSNKISVQLLQDILAGSLSGGDHVGTQQVAERYGVSRTPVREALGLLEARGVLERQVNRGYFVSENIPAEARSWLDQQMDQPGDEYQRLADDWLTDRLPEEVTEQYLRQAYGWTKSKIGDMLMRAVREGWAERKEGYGWRFLPVAKTPAAFDDIYRFRMAIEPVAMLEPGFAIDRAELDRQKRTQSAMLDGGIEMLPAERIIANGAHFHEELIRMSGNPYFLTALQRVNQMRRLMEYKTDINRERIRDQCGEHLELIALLERGEIAEASYFMRRHLHGALKRKSPIAWKWSVASRGT